MKFDLAGPERRVIPDLRRMKKPKNPAGQSDRHNSRGIELADRGWLDEAVKEFQKAIELDPESAPAHDNLATVYAEKRLYREAAREHLLALAMEPDNATTLHFNLAYFLSVHGPGDGHRRIPAADASRIEPDHADAHLNLGIAYADQGRLPEARSEFQLALQLEPREPAARHELAAIHMDDGNYRDAIGLLKEVVRLDYPKPLTLFLDLGICYAPKRAFMPRPSGPTAPPDRCGQRTWHSTTTRPLSTPSGSGRARPFRSSPRRSNKTRTDKVRSWLRSDPMFASLQGQAEFEALLG